MSTRGAWGFYRKGTDRITYNHSDSYPTWLGSNIKEFIGKHSIEELNRICDLIIMVDQHSTPTKAQIRECEVYHDDGVSTGQKTEWYSLIMNSQGDPEAYATDLRYMIDSRSFMQDSLFCEWAYIINLDSNELEIYEGFCKERQSNRYSMTDEQIKAMREEDTRYNNNSYYEVRLVKQIPFADVPKFDMELFEEDQNESKAA